MSKNIEPPSFISDSKSYETYERDVRRWQLLTTVKKENQAVMILHYLDGHKSGIKEKIDAGVKEEDLVKDTGVMTLLEFIKNIYEKDTIADGYEKFLAFIKIKREANATVQEFLAEWKMMYQRAANVGCKLSDKVLAFFLLDSMNISALDRNLVLTGVDYGEENLQSQMEVALKKFVGRNNVGEETRQVDSTFVTQDMERVFLAKGWTKPGSKVKPKPKKKREGGEADEEKKKNWTGKDGKVAKCFNCACSHTEACNCECTYHFAGECPKRRKTRVTQEENIDAALFMNINGPTFECEEVDISEEQLVLVCVEVNDEDELTAAGGGDIDLAAQVLDGQVDVGPVDRALDGRADVDPVSRADADQVPRGLNSQADVVPMARAPWKSRHLRISVRKDVVSLVPDINHCRVGDPSLKDGEEQTAGAGGVGLQTKLGDQADAVLEDGADVPVARVWDGHADVDPMAREPWKSSSISDQKNPVRDTPVSCSSVLVVDSTSITGIQQEEITLMIAEGCDTALVDSACPRTVAGTRWINDFLRQLPKNRRPCLDPSNRIFKFGGGEKRASKGVVVLPCVLGDKLSINIKVEVVDADLPLLIGNSTLRKGVAVLHFGSQKLFILGTEVELQLTASTHYSVKISPAQQTSKKLTTQDAMVFAVEEEKILGEKEMKRLHQVWGHCRAEKLKEVIKNAGRLNEESSATVDLVVSKCESCAIFKNRVPKPKSAPPKSTRRNQIVAMDLKELKNGLYILYMVDLFTRFVVAKVIHNKQAKTVAEAVLRYWVAVFGVMDAIHKDGGKEFNNDELTKVTEYLGTRQSSTAAYSPYQNGACERIHAIVDRMVDKMMFENSSMRVEVALCWAVNAYNNLTNNKGFSPSQLVFGEANKLPALYAAGPPGLEEVQVDMSIGEHIVALHAAREAFIHCEADQALRLALRQRVFARGEDVMPGDWIYFKNKSRTWEGPVKVTTKDGKLLYAVRAGRLLTINADHAVLSKSQGEIIVVEGQKGRVNRIEWAVPEQTVENQQGDARGWAVPEQTVENQQGGARGQAVPEQTVENQQGGAQGRAVPEQTVESLHDGARRGEEAPSQVDYLGEGLEDADVETVEGGAHHLRVEQVPEGDDDPMARAPWNESRTSVQKDTVRLVPDHNPNLRSDFDLVPGGAAHGAVDTQQAQRWEENLISYKDLRKQDVIAYKVNEAWKEGQLLLRLGKVASTKGKGKAGKYEFHWEIKDSRTGDLETLDTKICDEIRKVVEQPGVGDGEDINEERQETADPPEVLVESEVQEQPVFAVNIPFYRQGEKSCILAKKQELERFDEFAAYEEVKDVGQKTIGTHWVLTEKIKEGKRVVKARLTVRGDQEEQTDKIQTDSPTVRKGNINILLMLAARNQWTIRSSDVSSAFLQSKPIMREVFIKPPLERRRKGILWKLKKTVYGLVDASRGFYLNLAAEFGELGCVTSRMDPAMFIYFDDKDDEQVREPRGLAICQVDDVMSIGNSMFEANIMDTMKSKFKFGSEEELDFRYVGLNMVQYKEGVAMDNNHYVASLELADMSFLSNYDPQDTLGETGQTEFRSVVGKLAALAHTTRPDICFDTKQLSTKFGIASKKDLQTANKRLIKIKSEEVTLKFPSIGKNVEEWVLVGHGDAGIKSMPDKITSVGGYVLLLVNKRTAACCVLGWRSKQLKRKVISTLAGEALAMYSLVGDVVYCKEVLVQLFGKRMQSLHTIIFTDSKNLQEAIRSSSLVEDGWLVPDIAIIKDAVSEGVISEIRRVQSKEMLADCLTKAGASGAKLMEVLESGVYEIPDSL